MKILESLLSQCLGHTPSTSKERSVLNSNSDAATSQNLEKNSATHLAGSVSPAAKQDQVESSHSRQSQAAGDPGEGLLALGPHGSDGCTEVQLENL